MTQEKAIQEAKDFQQYLSEARDKFVKGVSEIVQVLYNNNLDNAKTTLRVEAENILIAFDHLIDKYASASSGEKGDKKFSESQVYTAINMARGVTFQTDREPTLHHSNKEIVEYLNSVAPKEHYEGEQFEDEEACAKCGATEGHYAYCSDYTND